MAPRLRLLPVLLLAGCAAETHEAAALQAAFETGQASLAALSPVLPAPPPPRPPAPPPRAATLVGLHPGLAGPGPSSAAELLGAAPEALRRWLGEPALRRPEAGAEVWLYAGEGCALDLVLYPAAGGLRVAHAEARANGAEPRTESACLRGIAAPRGNTALPAAAGPVAAPADRGV